MNYIAYFLLCLVGALVAVRMQNHLYEFGFLIGFIGAHIMLWKKIVSKE